MSVPALRQPKTTHVEVKVAPPNLTEPHNFLIVTLKGGKKLVVSSDAYHGMLTAGELFRCVFCETEMVRDVICKERHKTSENHRKMLESYPHVEEFKDNLIRKAPAATKKFLKFHIYKQKAKSHLGDNQMSKTCRRCGDFRVEQGRLLLHNLQRCSNVPFHPQTYNRRGSPRGVTDG